MVLRRVVITGDQEHGYIVTCPSVPGAVVISDDRDDALASMPAVIETALDVRRRNAEAKGEG